MNTPDAAQSDVLMAFQHLRWVPVPADADQGAQSAAWRPVLALLARAENPRCLDAALHQLGVLLRQAAACLPDGVKPAARASAQRFLAALAADCRAMLDRPDLAAARFPGVFGLGVEPPPPPPPPPPASPPPAARPWWEVLGVEQTAPREAIEKAYRRRRGLAHPDLGGDAAEFAEVVRAYRVAVA